MDEAYRQTIAEIDRTIAGAGERVEGLANNVNRALSVLLATHPDGLPAEERSLLLAFEALCVESLRRTAWLLHARGEHESAGGCLDLVRMLQGAVDEATRS